MKYYRLTILIILLSISPVFATRGGRECSSNACSIAFLHIILVLFFGMFFNSILIDLIDKYYFKRKGNNPFFSQFRKEENKVNNKQKVNIIGIIIFIISLTVIITIGILSPYLTLFTLFVAMIPFLKN